MEALNDILADLLRREPIFHRPDFPTRMSPDYFEIGASGRRYDHAFILKHLAENPPPLIFTTMCPIHRSFIAMSGRHRSHPRHVSVQKPTKWCPSGTRTPLSVLTP